MPLKLERPKKGKIWYVSGTVGGRRLRKSTGTTKRALANSLKAQWEAELENRRIYGDASVATFGEAVENYINAGGEERYLLPLLEHFGNGKLLTDLDQKTLNAMAPALYPRCKASTLDRYVYTPFIAIMNNAAEDGLCPVKKWKRPKGRATPTQFRWLWPDEFEAVWQAAPPHGRVILDTLAGTGIRETEGVGLEFSDLSLRHAQAWLWKTKNNDPRRIELPARTVTSIETALHDEGPVLLNGGGAPFVVTSEGGGALATSLRTWALDAGVKPFGAHVLRHTFATWFYSATLDIMRLKYLGGWKSDTVERYTHLAPRGLKDELRKFGWDFEPRKNWRIIDEQLGGSEIVSINPKR